MAEIMIKLNIGSGQFKKEGYINIDIDTNTKPDIVWNLDRFPYPFADNEFKLIEANHVLEHLDNPFAVMKELHRILKHNGNLIIRVPHFSRGFTHADHKHGFDVTFPLYFNPKFKGGYTGTEFKLEYMRFHWFAQSYLKKTLMGHPTFVFSSLLGNIIDLFAYMSPYFCSRIWCYWIGGFEEIEFRFRK